MIEPYEADRSMSNSAPVENASVRLAMIGMPCAETAATLEALIAEGRRPIVVLLSGAAPSSAPLSSARTRFATLPVFSPDDPAAVARLSGIPVVWLGKMSSVALAQLATELRDRDVDVAIVACFPWRLPVAVLAIPRWGVLNVHPSLLPRWRGPEPLFWTFQAGDAEAGVTVHRMDVELDSGPILAQMSVPFPEGAQLPDFERSLMRLGGVLAAQVVRHLAEGSAKERPQPKEGVRLAPNPTPADWVIRADWTVDRAEHFARAVQPLGGPLAIETPEGARPLARILSARLDQPAAERESPLERAVEVPGITDVPLADGTLTVVLRD